MPSPTTPRIHPFVLATTLVAGVVTLTVGVAALVDPAWFADAVEFPAHEHFVHDVGAFQAGIGASLLLAAVWGDALAVALAAFVVSATLHAVAHAVDRELGGRASDPWLLGALAVATAAALVVHLRGLGYVTGRVSAAGTPALDRFVRQKTAVLTTYRRDGSPVATPLSVAVDGDRAVFRTYERAGKTRRLRRDPSVQVAPSTARGTPTGPAVRGRARRLDGAEAVAAARLLRRKHPVLHGVVVPFGHRVARARTGRTVHFELVPVGDGVEAGAADGGTGAAVPATP
jgi:PPOX class probable F420-dependent enzyme